MVFAQMHLILPFLIPLPCLTFAIAQVHAEMEVSVSRLVPACLTVSVISGGGVRWALKQFFVGWAENTLNYQETSERPRTIALEVS